MVGRSSGLHTSVKVFLLVAGATITGAFAIDGVFQQLTSFQHELLTATLLTSIPAVVFGIWIGWRGKARKQSCWTSPGLLDAESSKGAELSLQEERDILAALLASLPGIFLLIDNQGRYIRWNDNLRHLTGLSDEQLGI